MCMMCMSPRETQLGERHMCHRYALLCKKSSSNNNMTADLQYCAVLCLRHVIGRPIIVIFLVANPPARMPSYGCFTHLCLLRVADLTPPSVQTRV